jgi:hypothetical protein
VRRDRRAKEQEQKTKHGVGAMEIAGMRGFGGGM